MMNSPRFISDKDLQYLRDYCKYKIGKNVKIANSCSIYCKELEIGDNSLISDYTLLTGTIKMGKFCHIAHYTHISGSEGEVKLADYVGIGSRCSIYTANDDYLGNSLYTPCPDKYCARTYGRVTMEKFVMLGWGSFVFPSSYLEEGAHFGFSSKIRGRYPGYALYTSYGNEKAKFNKQLPKYIMADVAKKLEENLK